MCNISKACLNSNWSYRPETPDLGQNRRFYVPCDFEIWWMTLEKNRAPLLYHTELYASFQSHWGIQTGVTVRKHIIRVKIGDFFVPWVLEIWWMTLKNNRTPLLYYVKLCASFQSHWWIETGVTIRKSSIRVKICDLCYVWPWILTDDLEKQ